LPRDICDTCPEFGKNCPCKFWLDLHPHAVENLHKRKYVTGKNILKIKGNKERCLEKR